MNRTESDSKITETKERENRFNDYKPEFPNLRPWFAETNGSREGSEDGQGIALEWQSH